MFRTINLQFNFCIHCQKIIDSIMASISFNMHWLSWGFVCTTICLIFWIFITSALEVFGIFRIYHWYRCRVKTSLHRSVRGRWFYFEITEYMYYCDKLKSTIYKRIKCLLRIITGQYLSNIEIRIVSLLWKLLRLGSLCLSLTVTVHTYNDLTNFKFNETA